ncbi:MAG: LamB/YcsF family protein [Actinomycetota bacterium]
MSLHVDLNADVGEGERSDLELMGVVTSVSIACGGHAGDQASMRRTVAAARNTGQRLGAHPSYPDRANFGRFTVSMEPEALRRSIVDQVRALIEAAGREAAEIAYIKPHGALYNDAVGSSAIADQLFAAAEELDLPVMLLASARQGNIREGFVDRAYMPDGSLKARGLPGAMILDPAGAAHQALALAGKVDSLCVHSDTPGALELISSARSALEQAGFVIGP